MLTGISGSWTVAMASISASSVGSPDATAAGLSPSGVHTVFGVVSFTGCLLGPVQGGDQRVPRQRGAFYAGWIFVHARQRRQAFQRRFQGGAAIRARSGAGHATERLEQRLGVARATPLDHLGHQIGRSDADRTSPSLEPDSADGFVFQLDPDLDAVAAHRVVALGCRVERLQPLAVPWAAAVVENDLLV